jgi:hypothetical protein
MTLTQINRKILILVYNYIIFSEQKKTIRDSLKLNKT